MQTKYNSVYWKIFVNRSINMSQADNEVCFGRWFCDWNALVHEVEARECSPSNTGAKEKVRPVVPLMQIQTMHPRSDLAAFMRGLRPTSIRGVRAGPTPGSTLPASSEVQRAPGGSTVRGTSGTLLPAHKPTVQQGSLTPAHPLVVQQGPQVLCDASPGNAGGHIPGR